MGLTWVAGLMNPTVVSGKVLTESINYPVKASETFKAGELVRFTTGGTVAVAKVNSASGGAIHGIALKDAADYLTGGDHAGEKFPVALLEADTVMAMQLAANKDANDVIAGELSALVVSSNYWSVADTATNPVVQIHAKPEDDAWFDPDLNVPANNTGPIYVTVIASVLTSARQA